MTSGAGVVSRTRNWHFCWPRVTFAKLLAAVLNEGVPYLQHFNLKSHDHFSVKAPLRKTWSWEARFVNTCPGPNPNCVSYVIYAIFCVTTNTSSRQIWRKLWNKIVLGFGQSVECWFVFGFVADGDVNKPECVSVTSFSGKSNICELGEFKFLPFYWKTPGWVY